MDLSKIREKIDKLDFELVKILSERTELVKDIIQYKQENKLQIVQENRMEDMLKKRRELAKKFDLAPDFIEPLFLSIINESIKAQKKAIGKKS